MDYIVKLLIYQCCYDILGLTNSHHHKGIVKVLINVVIKIEIQLGSAVVIKIEIQLGSATGDGLLDVHL